MDKQVKCYLKAAKGSIKNEDFEVVLENCEKVLQIEPKNYTALVFKGVALKGSSNYVDSIRVFREAVEVSSDLALAWQGLGSVYEKSGSNKYRSELKDVYLKLVQLLPQNDGKLKDICFKLSFIQVQCDEITECLTTLDSWQSSCSAGEYDSATVLSLMETKTLSKEQEARVARHIILTNLGDSKQHRSLMIFGLTLLYRLGDSSNLLAQALRMAEKFPESVVAPEWVLRCCLEFNRSHEHLSPMVERLLSLEPKNPFCHLAQAQIAVSRASWSDALHNLERLTGGGSSAVPEWLVLNLRAQVLLARHESSAAEDAVRGALAKWPASRCDVTARLNLAQSLVVQGGSFRMEEAIQLLDSLTSLVDSEQEQRVAELRLEIDLLLGRLTLDEAEDRSASKHVLARLHRERGDRTAALALLRSENSPECLRLLGEVLVEAGDVAEGVAVLRRAIDADPFHWRPFYNLGLILQQRDPERAIRCLQRAWRLSPHQPECGVLLSELLSTANREEEHGALLVEATRPGVDAFRARWALVRLATLRLATNDGDQVILPLQAALRTLPDDRILWECLADAYQQRGSVSAALEAYNRVIKLSADCSSSSSVYSRLQLARLLQSRGQWPEAECQYATVLEQAPLWPAGIFGVAEADLKQARVLIQQGRTGRAQYHLQLAVDRALCVVRLLPRASSVWRLVADIVFATSLLPSQQAWLRFPDDIRNVASPEDASRMEADALLKLAVRLYAQALQVCETAPVWHAIARCYLRLFMFGGSHALLDENTTVNYSELALRCALKAVDLLEQQKPSSEEESLALAQAYNTVAVASARCWLWARAQDALIRCLRVSECSATSAVAWTNLAALYLHHGDAELAHEALTRAQSSDAEYGACWAGQALVADKLAPQQSVDLFRHACLLKWPSTVGCLSLAHSVCSAVAQREVVSIEAVSEAYQALHANCGFLIERESVAINLLGVLCELHIGPARAVSLYRRALHLSNDSDVMAVSENLTRCLLASGDWLGVERLLAPIEPSRLSVMCLAALSLAYIHTNKLESAQTLCHAALSSRTSLSSHTRSQLSVVMSSVLYRRGLVQEARALLLARFSDSVQPRDVCCSVLSLGAWAVRENDTELAVACVPEVSSALANGSGSSVDSVMTAVLLSCLQASLSPLRTVCASQPWIARAWKLLATALLHCQLPGLALSAALSAAALSDSGRQKQVVCVSTRPPTSDNQTEELVALCHLLCGNLSAALRWCQLALLRRPTSAAAWCVLLVVVPSTANLQLPPRWLSGAAQYSASLLIHTEENEQLITWARRASAVLIPT